MIGHGNCERRGIYVEKGATPIDLYSASHLRLPLNGRRESIAFEVYDILEKIQETSIAEAKAPLHV